MVYTFFYFKARHHDLNSLVTFSGLGVMRSDFPMHTHGASLLWGYPLLTDQSDLQDMSKQVNNFSNYLSTNTSIIAHSRSLHCDILELETLRNDLVQVLPWIIYVT